VLLDLGSIRVERRAHDRYGRTLARVLDSGIDVGARVLAEGSVLKYEPGREAKLARLRVWCGRGAQLEDRFDRVPIPQDRPLRNDTPRICRRAVGSFGTDSLQGY